MPRSRGFGEGHYILYSSRHFRLYSHILYKYLQLNVCYETYVTGNSPVVYKNNKNVSRRPAKVSESGGGWWGWRGVSGGGGVYRKFL